jgi:hypothetical protein
MVADFQPEVLLAIFEFFPLKSLLAAKGVNKQWRILSRLCDMTKARRVLYDLYHTAIISPTFLESRSFVLSCLVPFDRKAYVAALENKGHILPDDFRCWLLEWPAKAVFGWVWPGLDPQFDMSQQYVWKPYGSNSLGLWLESNGPPDRSHTEVHLSVDGLPYPTLERLAFFYPSHDNKYPPWTGTDPSKEDLGCDDPDTDLVMINGVQIWYHGCTVHTWIIVDEEKPLLHGTVYSLDGYQCHRERGLVANSWHQWLMKSLSKMDQPRA